MVSNDSNSGRAFSKNDVFVARVSAGGQEQTTERHLTETAELAKLFGTKFGAGSLAQLSALFHDIGKFSKAFVGYLRNSVEQVDGLVFSQRGSVIHSTQGAKYITTLLSDKEEIYSVIAEIIANCIAGHHGGLTDGISPSGDTPLRNRILSDKHELHYDEVINNFQNSNTLFSNIDDLLSGCRTEIDTFFEKCRLGNLNTAFMVHLLVKSVYSCLVDADRYDAYCFDAGLPPEAQVQAPPWGDYSSQLESYISAFQMDSDIAYIRRAISNDCYSAAKRERGIYKLTVPTGGGKTLSSLRFALNHAKKHNLERIIYVIPYLSVLEQTASEVRKGLSYGKDDDFILEHHSNLLLPEDENELQAHLLLTSRWSQPIIITTMVQFLESAFSHKSGDLRKLHSLMNSVIIFDEIQSLPVKCVHLFNGLLDYLHVLGGCTTLLCTATQPPLDKVICPVHLSIEPELINGSHDEFAKLKRTRIVDSTVIGGYSYDDLCDFVIEKLIDVGNCLVILNTKKDVAILYESVKLYIKENPNCEIRLVHLSTAMCPAHRMDAIDSLQTLSGNKRQLKDERILCISTQLIEAGVDISFGCVIRALAGLDSIAQAAGRCNRHGEYSNGKEVYIVNLSEENLDKLPDIKCGSDVAKRILGESSSNLLSPSAMGRYYDEYFYKLSGEMDYNTKDLGSLYNLLSSNKKGLSSYENYGGKTPPYLRHAFKTAGENFYIIDRGTTGVLVPYERGIELAEEYGIATLHDRPKLLREMGRYSVSLYKWQINKLDEERAIFAIGGDVLALRQGYYDIERGVTTNGKLEFLEG